MWALLICLCLTVHAAAALLDYSSTNTYRNEVITPDNIKNLLKSTHRLHKSAKQKIVNFIENKELAPILSGHSDQELFFTGTDEVRAQRKADIETYLAERELHSLSNHSFILPVEDWIIKKSHTYIARQNVADTLASIEAQAPTWAPYKYILTPDEWHNFQQLFNGKVYQNTSRAMIYLRAKEAQEILSSQGKATIEIPETHLIHIPGRPKEIEDRNYIIVEKKIDAQGIPWKESPLAIDPLTILTMVEMIAYTGWWNMEDSTKVCDNTLYFFDHELPNRHDIRHIFHQDKDHFRYLVRTGWEALEEHIMKPYAEAHNVSITDLLEQKKALQDYIETFWN